MQEKTTTGSTRADTSRDPSGPVEIYSKHKHQKPDLLVPVRLTEFRLDDLASIPLFIQD